MEDNGAAAIATQPVDQPSLPPALSEVSFTAQPGQTVDLVGHSGAGKSTCTHLLLRFWDMTSGRIAIGGHDLRAFTLATLHELITLVPQKIYLFNMSIADNIRLGRPEAGDAKVEQAARLALAHEFIAALPQGYAANAGERGAQLSGGQRQRIASASVFVKDAPILIMTRRSRTSTPRTSGCFRRPWASCGPGARPS